MIEAAVMDFAVSRQSCYYYYYYPNLNCELVWVVCCVNHFFQIRAGPWLVTNIVHQTFRRSRSMANASRYCHHVYCTECLHVDTYSREPLWTTTASRTSSNVIPHSKQG